MKKTNVAFYFLVVFFLSIEYIYAQTEITGTVKSASSEVSLTSMIILKDSTEQIIQYKKTKSDGNFSLKIANPGNYRLQIASISYESQVIEIEISPTTTHLSFDVLLMPKSILLDEVIVTRLSAPVVIKKDTVIIDASSFLQGNEQVVEDLLKKIPGLQVMSDGTIKVGNQEVEKIMVDGDDFFERGYKVLTKNMPVHPIKNIEIYQNYSNNRLLKGIENSDRVALNLTIKEDAKRVWFGNVFGGYDVVQQRRHELRGSLMNFGKKSKFNLLSNFNNIGLNAVGDINHLIRPIRIGEPSSLGDDRSSKTLMGLSMESPPLESKRVNLNNTGMLALNTIFTLSEKTKLKVLGFLHTDQNEFFKNSYKSYQFGEVSFENTEDFVGLKRLLSGLGKVDLHYNLSENQAFDYTGKVSKSRNRSTGDLLFNGDPIIERLNDSNQLIDNKVVYTNRWTQKKVFMLTARHITEQTPQQYTSNQFLFSDLFGDAGNRTNQYSNNSLQFTGVEGHLMDRKANGDLLEIRLGNTLENNGLTSRFSIREDDITTAEPSSYQNLTDYASYDIYLLAKYRKAIRRFDLIMQTDVHQLFNRINYQDEANIYKPLFIIPKIGIDWKLNENNKLLTSYTYSTKSPGILDIYPNFIQTGYRSLERGINSFNLLTASSAIINYTYGNWGSNLFINTLLLYSKDHDFMSTNSFITQDYVQTTRILLRNKETTSIVLNVDRYIKAIESNIKFNISSSQASFRNIVNDADLRTVNSINLNYDIELRSGFVKRFNYHIGTRWKHNRIQTSITNTFTDNMSFIDFDLAANDKLSLQLKTERYYFGGIDHAQNTIYFQDVETKYLLKDNKLSLFISAHNLFNIKTFVNYSITDVNIAQTAYRLQPRYVMLKVDYRF